MLMQSLGQDDSSNNIMTDMSVNQTNMTLNDSTVNEAPKPKKSKPPKKS